VVHDHVWVNRTGPVFVEPDHRRPIGPEQLGDLDEMPKNGAPTGIQPIQRLA
jgi:hypothetical protein